MLGNMGLGIDETMQKTRTIWRGMVPMSHSKLMRALATLPTKTRNSEKMRELVRNSLESPYLAREYLQQEDLSRDQASAAALKFAATMAANTGRCQT